MLRQPTTWGVAWFLVLALLAAPAARAEPVFATGPAGDGFFFPQAGVVVYDNTQNATNFAIFGTAGAQLGDQITLAGTARAVTQIDLLLARLGAAPVTTNVTLRLFANDGPTGLPGTLLFQTTVPQVLVDSFNTPLSIDVPGIEVPDSLSFTASFTSGSVGLRLFNPPVLGTSDNFGLFGQGPPALGRFSFPPPVPPINFFARVTAQEIPEPGSAALLGLGVLGLFGYARRRRAPAA